MEVRVGPAVIVTHLDDEVLVSETNGTISSEAQQGYFVADTRLVSAYRLRIGRREPVLLNSSQIEAHSARFEFTNERFLDDENFEVPEHSVHLRLDRVLGRGVHEDYSLTNYSGGVVDCIVELSIESDFADLFDVRNQRLQRRGILRSTWEPRTETLHNHFVHESFERGLLVEARESSAPATYANGGLLFPVKIEHGGTWRACVLWRPVLDDEVTGERKGLLTVERCHDLVRKSSRPGPSGGDSDHERPGHNRHDEAGDRGPVRVAYADARRARLVARRRRRRRRRRPW